MVSWALVKIILHQYLMNEGPISFNIRRFPTSSHPKYSDALAAAALAPSSPAAAARFIVGDTTSRPMMRYRRLIAKALLRWKQKEEKKRLLSIFVGKNKIEQQSSIYQNLWGERGNRIFIHVVRDIAYATLSCLLAGPSLPHYMLCRLPFRTRYSVCDGDALRVLVPMKHVYFKPHKYFT